jgi:hypothetical protein
MPHLRLGWVRVIVVVLVAMGVWSMGFCQPQPVMYQLVQQFGMANPVSTRLLGMGAITSCVNDVPFANAAFAAALDTSEAGVRYSTTSFDNGPTLSTAELHYTAALHPRQSGLQLSVLDSTSGGDPVNMGLLGPVQIDMTERGFVVDYGRRLNRRLCAGLSVLGYERTQTTWTGLPGAYFDVVGKASYGGRLGASYEWQPGDYFGAIYNFSQDDVDVSGLLIGPPASLTFRSTQLSLGGSYHVIPKLMVAAEYQRGTVDGGGISAGGTEWHFGAEYQAAPQWALRAGLADHAPTFGIGYQGGRWQAAYAFIHNWNGQNIGPLLGGSDTHSLHVTYSW